METLYPNPDQPFEIDLGAGDGGFVIQSAMQYPEINFLAIERLKGRAMKIAKKADQLGLRNVRVLRLDALYSLEYLVPKRSVSCLHLLFPDPWPKRRHAKYRLLQMPFLKALRRVLKTGGYFHFATDDLNYWQQGLALIASCPVFYKCDFPRALPLTDFEQMWLASGRTSHHAWWRYLE
ncbi:MAG: tRNA (guanosine(46)-N7)-methyltransferase TrmB [Methylacidiphilales bacterium]|nr:tRNA (guanosine(46)-N7)-methyltransferase TrmB [Candidatus Methylacidiphilales bacterium]MDW8349763.1 tRNA (guanosine(46)-N7)-methyltransferase TrmB [Verrucomicrobiae bacterium]